MNRNRKTALLIATTVATTAIAASWIVYTYLPISPEQPKLTVGCLVVGVILAFVVYLAITKLPDANWVRLLVCTLFVLWAATPILSAFVSRITYSRFGFTVYGGTPVPFLDITVNRHGVLWFRPKTHQITREELMALVTPEVEIVVVGIGWDSIAQLTDEAKQLGETLDLRVLPTPEAFALYNQLKAEGRCVVLLAHSTC